MANARYSHDYTAGWLRDHHQPARHGDIQHDTDTTLTLRQSYQQLLFLESDARVYVAGHQHTPHDALVRAAQTVVDEVTAAIRTHQSRQPRHIRTAPKKAGTDE